MGRKAIPVKRIDLINGEEKEYPSISECARDTETENIAIREVLSGKWTQHRGYKFIKA